MRRAEGALEGAERAFPTELGAAARVGVLRAPREGTVRTRVGRRLGV